MQQPTHIYHVMTKADWKRVKQTPSHSAPSLESEGFIHFCTAAQIEHVGNKHYQGQADLLLLCVESAKLTDPLKLKYEDSYGDGRLFPHLYGPLNTDAVVRAIPFPAEADGSFKSPLIIEPAPIKELITFADFEKLDIRIGTIESVSAIEKSDKLMKLTVNFGDHTRTILAGIKKERDNPQEIAGKQALFVVNMPDRKMAGEVSQGMLFDIGYADKLLPCLAMPEVPMPNGSRAG